MKVIEGENGDLLIESIEGIEESSEDFDAQIERYPEAVKNGTVEIEGFGSWLKKSFKKVSKIGKIASNFGLLPPGASFGLGMLNKLAGSSKTKKRVKFSAGATRDVYKAAYLKGYAKGLKQVELYARKARR
jgi:hypothetical protein